ncbi:hypothetical protein T492DRAFT_989676 [Pavlovales sp. CCMP2436]|nr:hypothetical protein T492DRAFT_989676 [Pavlovales sp. CCMP2436]
MASPGPASPSSPRAHASWIHAIRRAERDKLERDYATARRATPPRISELRKYWWIIRPYGRRHLAWEVIGVIVVTAHALGNLLWYGEHNAKLHNHGICLAGGLGRKEAVNALEEVSLLSPRFGFSLSPPSPPHTHTHTHTHTRTREVARRPSTSSRRSRSSRPGAACKYL